MEFTQAIQSCFTQFAEFKGVASRSEYWWWTLFCTLLLLGLGVLHPKLMQLGTLGVALPSLAVTTRRLHDIDKSGWWQLIGLIPLVGMVALLVMCAQPSKSTTRFQ